MQKAGGAVRSRSARKGLFRRRLRSLTIVAVLLLAMDWTVSTADASQLAKPMTLHLPSLARVEAWFQSPHWGWLPKQLGGSADGKSHSASSAATRAGGGAGRAPGRGRGELPAYSPHLSKSATGPSGKPSGGRFDAKTSTFVGAKSSATVSWYQNIDGSVTKKVAEQAVNYQVSPGVWAPIDSALAADGSGRLAEKANSLGVSFAASSGGAAATTQSASSSASGDLAAVTISPTQSVGWSLSGAARVAASVSGNTATYPQILPGTSVSETAGGVGDKESIVLASAAAGNSWAFPLDIKGLTPSLDAGGAVQFKDSTGAVAARIPLAYATDSKVNPVSGDAATTWKVEYSLAKTDTGYALTVTLDSGWLNDPARVFPVTVDPTMIVSIVGTTSTTYVDSTATGDYSSDTRIKEGECTAADCGAEEFANSFIKFPTFPDGQGYYATSASLNMFDTWTATSIGSAKCTTANASQFSWSNVYVAPVTQGWSVTGSKAYPGPSYGASIGSAAPATWNACTNTAASLTTGDWVSISLDPTYMNYWSYNVQPDYGLAVYGATGALTWRKYDSDMEGNYTPYLSVTYTDQAPQVTSQYPPNGYSASTLTPELLASAARPANSTTTTALTYDFVVEDGNGTVLKDSGAQSTGHYVVPSGVLKWGQTYYWTVTASDGTLSSVSQPLESLTIAVPQPVITSALSQNSGHGFDQSSGNYTTSATDADVSTVGPKLQVARDYNSRDPRTTGAFGAGWSSVFDAKAIEQYNTAGAVTSVTVTYPDGSQVGFGKNSDGTYAPPSGRFATFKPATTGYTLTDKNDTTYTFGQSLGSGAYGISAVSDASGRAVDFTWSGAQITTMTSAVSGRALHLTWSTPTGATGAHVATVYTDPVTGTDATTDLTWKYFYSGDQLGEVCDPKNSGACTGASTDVATKYAYNAGSQYESAVLDSGPHSLWPFSETSGTTANSAVIANEGNDNATYSNVTLGGDAFVSGITSTSGAAMCIDDATSSTTDGNKVQLYNCNATNAQNWQVNSNKTITVLGKCLDAASGGTTNGTLIDLYTCSGATSQQWTFGANGSLVNVNSGTCLDDPTSSQTAGTQLQLYTCDNTAAQKWTHDNGPFNTSTATSATTAFFDGSSSYATLPNSLVSGASYESISLWFKTTGSSEVLYSYSQDKITGGTTNVPYTPALYVGTDGKLIGSYWTGSTANYIETSSAVNNGAWHHVVLSGAAATQTMYVDGAAVGTLSGTIALTSQINDYVGAGYIGGGWPDETHSSTTSNTGYASYFKGSIADVAFYTKPLVQADVTGLYNAAKNKAALMTSVTRPSGKTYATVAYDPATSRVTSVTDDNGGTWTLGAPTVTGTSDAYRSAVMGSAPAGYYRLGDAAGSANAYSEVNYGAGTYNNVTLGAAGPFSDKTAAAFNGTSSYLQLPQTDQVATGPNSVELWFTMAAGSTGGGVLFDEMGQPITSSTPEAQGWDPALYVGTDGRLHGQFWINNISASTVIASPGLVNDGKWHHVVLAATTTSQTMYLDGNAVGTVSGTLSATALGYIYVGAGETDGAWPFHPTNTLGYFPGSIAELAFYRAQLSATQVAGHYAAYKSGVSGISPTQVNTVTDPGGKTLTYKYDALNGDRLMSETDGTGATTSYGYDTSGFLYTTTDANGNVTTTGHDVRGNTVSQTTCQNQASQVCSTEYYTYYPDDTTATLTTADPRNDLTLSYRDGRSSSSSDPTYATTYTYDTAGDRTAVTTPPVPGFPSGRTTSTTYSDGTSAFPAADSGSVPAGLPMTTVAPGGSVNRVAYYHDGDVASTTDADGQVTTYTYDGIGRVLTKTVNPGSPTAWWPLNQTTGTAVHDASGTGNGATASNVTWSGGAGVFNGTSSQVTTGSPIVNTGASFSVSAWVDLSSIPSSYADVMTVGGSNQWSAYLLYSKDNGSWSFVTTSADVKANAYYTAGATTAPTAGAWTHLVGEYDAAAHVDKLYVNGTLVKSVAAPQGWSATKTMTIGSGNGSAYFPGSIANVQLYQRALADADVSTIYGAGYSGSTVSSTTPNGLVTSLTYDQLGQVVAQTDPPVTNRVTGAVHTATTTTSYDADGEVLSQTVADSAAGGDSSRTVSATYNAYDEEQTSTDALGNVTSLSYDGYGNKTSETAPDGTVTNSTYDADGNLLTQTLANYTGDPVNPSAAKTLTEVSKAYDPAHRLASTTDSMGNVTSYTYTDNGLVSTVTRTDSTGANKYVLQTTTYDAAGNIVRKTTGNNSLTTTYQVDAADRTTQSVVDPTGADRTTTVSYTPNDEVASSTETDPGGWDRTATYTYDPMGNKTSQSLNLDASGHPVGWYPLTQSTGGTVTDASGTGNTATATGAKWTGTGASFSGATGQQIATNGPVVTTTASYSVSAWVNLAAAPTGNQTAVSQDANVASGFYLQYESTDKSWAFAHVSADSASPTATRAHGTATPSAGTWYHLVGTYDSSTGAMTLYVNGASAGTATDTAPFAASGPLAIGRGRYGSAAADLFDGQVANVQVYNRVLSAGEVSSLYSAGQNGGSVASSSWQTTSWQRDVRGLPVSETDPNGNTTSFTYDEAGHQAVSVAPTVTAEVYGSTPVSVHPTTMSGYDAFGEETQTEDAGGYITDTVYDANGNKVSQTLPSYTAPGSSTATTATSTWTYDKNGSLSSETDPAGNTTNYTYDQLGDEATVTTPDGGVTHTTYDTNGDVLSATDPTGAQTQATYDWLGRKLTASTLERYPTAQTLTTTLSYAASGMNPGGANIASVTTPDGVTMQYGYDALGEKTQQIDAAGNSTKYSYNFMGDPYITTYADGTTAEEDYNAAEQLTATKNYDATGALLTSQTSTYDAVGNQLSSTDARGNTTTFTYDATNAVTQEVQPVGASSSITTSFGYDAAGNQTRYTDGNGNNWYTTYNSWGLKESQVEPSTSTYNTAANSTTTYAYNQDAQLASETLPGGATQSFTYSTMGDLLTQSGAGAAAATATRTFTYDLNGQMLTAGTSNTSTTSTSNATNESFTYDDRGDLLTASGSAGATANAYNGDGMLTSRQDASGATSYTYDNVGRVATAADAATSTTLTYGYNSLNQLSSVAYGSAGDTRSYSYNSQHELTGDTLKTSGGATVASISYGYDNNGNLTTKNTTGFGTAATNTYTYDYANRLTSWNNGTTNTAYSYDAAGNRTQVGSNVYTYDARNQLTSDGVNSYSYTAYGTLASQSSTSTSGSFTSDAYGQEITAGVAAYTYDALDRAVTRTDTSTSAATSLQYSGTSNGVASDGSYVYTRDATGGLLGVNTVGGSSSTGQLVLTDQHTDVVGDFTPTGTALAGTTAYDPLGNTVGTSTKTGSLGYQSEYTDSSTGQVNMASRWYNPAVGQFTSKDTAQINPVGNSANANPFAYAADDPMIGTDPTGHCWICSVWNDATSAVSTAWNDTTSFVSSAWDDTSSWAEDEIIRPMHHFYTAYVAPVVHTVVHAATTVYHHVRDAWHYTYHWVRRQVHRAWHAVKHAYHAAVHFVKSAYHATVHAVKRAYHAAAKAVGHAVHSAVTFVKHHAAAIASFALSTVAFMGCEAVLGAATGGVGAVAGAVACGAFSGMVGGLVDQGAKCISGQKGGCSVGSFIKSGLIGGVVGAAGGALGSLGGKLLGKLAPKALDAVGGLFGRGASDAVDASATDAAESGAGAEARSATQSAESGADNPGEAAKSADDGSASEGSDGNSSCPSGLPHSFTGATPVLMADGSTKAIDQVKVGDHIADAVPGQSATQDNTVTNVIVTKTDHDFVSLDIKPLAPGTSTAASKATTTVKSVLKKAAVGLAAAVAALGAATATANTSGQPGTTASAATTTATTVSQQGGTLTTTFHHPFYDITQAAFVDAQNLKAGDELQTPTGHAVVAGIRLYHANTVTYDLTIGALHTYYVIAGDTPVLVHNCQITPGDNELSQRVMQERLRLGKRNGNFAAALIGDGSGNTRIAVAYATKGVGNHAERKLLDKVELQEGEKILQVYSEREPCTGTNQCRNILNGRQIPYTYAFPWTTSAEGTASNKAMKAYVSQLFDDAKSGQWTNPWK